MMRQFRRNAVGTDRWTSGWRGISFLILYGLFVVLQIGCDRKNNPVFGSRPAGVDSINVFIPQIERGQDAVNRIFVSVTDASGTPITGMQMGNFSILEGGAPGIPYSVGPVTEPLFLALAIDRSGSMGGPYTVAANNAAVDLVNALGANDYAALVEFASEVTVRVPFTSNKTTLINAINAGTPGGMTTLYDAISQCAALVDGQAGRCLILVLTDGADTASQLGMSTAIYEVNRRGFSAYTVGLGNAFEADVLEAIANLTGGSFYTSELGDDLSDIFLGVLERYNNLYYIRYRRRSKGGITVYVNLGGLTGSASKSFD